MPRRPSKLRREAGSKRPKPLRRSDGKIKKWNTREDIPMDEEDQFHDSRDKILLEGTDGGAYENDGDDDEVFALNGLEVSGSEDEDEYNNQEDEDEAEIAPEPKKKSKKNKKDKGKKKVEEDESDKEGEEESWGKGKAAYYSSNADQLDTDDEEGNELEEQEAKRLQSKMREEMKDDDFGLDDNPDLEKAHELEQILAEAENPSSAPSADKKSLLRHLETTSPEALALARDWDDTIQSLEKTKQKISKLEVEGPDAHSLGMVHLHYQALLSYSTTLAFYLHLRSSAKYSQRPTLLQSHPILQRLLTLKQSLQTMEDLDFAASDSDSEDYDESELSSMNTDEIMADGEMLWDRDNSADLEANELAELLEDAEQIIEEPKAVIRKPPKKKRKTSETEDRQGTIVDPVFDLVEPEFTSSKLPSSSRRQHVEDAADAFGEATTLHSVDAADKTARKKSLRFHTSKIESASARRQGARSQAVGGDDDIPYRERKKEKDTRLVKEAAIRAKNQVGVPLDDEEPQTGDKRSREDDDGEESPDDYYELVKKKSQEQKLKKKAEYEEAHGIERVPLEGGSAGPRSLTRAILTNRGLTPHRPKSVRNPRVKKRERYEKAKKKLASQKPIYKGGLSETGGKYVGEKSGISKVVKSVRLG